MIWSLILLLVSQTSTLAPPPINFERIEVPVDKEIYVVTYVNGSLNMSRKSSNGYLPPHLSMNRRKRKPRDMKIKYTPNEPPKENEEKFINGCGCILAIIAPWAAIGLTLWWIFK